MADKIDVHKVTAVRVGPVNVQGFTSEGTSSNGKTARTTGVYGIAVFVNDGSSSACDLLQEFGLAWVAVEQITAEFGLESIDPASDIETVGVGHFTTDCIG